MTDAFELLIVGGGPAGLAAARAYRERRRDGEVAIVADEHRMPYERPPLTKELLRGEIGFDELAIEDEDWLTEQRVRLISGRAVTLDAGERTVDAVGRTPAVLRHLPAGDRSRADPAADPGRRPSARPRGAHRRPRPRAAGALDATAPGSR